MDTNTIIELFEELRKQLTSLSRRIDDRNISAPAPVTTDDKIARLLETAQFTRTNVERVRMELAVWAPDSDVQKDIAGIAA